MTGSVQTGTRASIDGDGAHSVATARLVTMTRFLALSILVAASVFAGDTVRTETAGLRFAVPRSWTRVPTALETRAAQYRIPAAPGDTAETELVLFFAGEGKGGDAGENLERWYRRFLQRDGRPSREAAIVTMSTVRDLKVTAVDLGGTYVGSGTGSTEVGVSGFRMLGAHVEGKGGPWIFDLLGPEASVRQAKGDFHALVSSLEPHR
jgi:hypothetical protein